jgi:ribosome maturation factor RimP
MMLGLSDPGSGRKPTFLLDSGCNGTMKEVILPKVREIATRVGGSEGIDIVDVELAGGGGSRVLRITIDKAEGVTHGDCETISQQVGTILDVEDVIPGGRYTLQVSSPGVERRLVRPEDFVRFQGKKAKITLKEPLENRRHWEGVLAGFSDGCVTLEESPGRRVDVQLQQIQRANLKFEW